MNKAELGPSTVMPDTIEESFMDGSINEQLLAQSQTWK
jgi:hypothetical protein